MRDYIATFFTHYGAIQFHRACAGRSWPARLMPVPRALSSSCGTCVRFTPDHLLKAEDCAEPLVTEDVEQIVTVTEDGYAPLYRAEG